MVFKQNNDGVIYILIMNYAFALHTHSVEEYSNKNGQ